MRKEVKTRGKTSIRKRIAVISGSIIGFLLILCLSALLIINGYLGKVNYDPGTDSLVSNIEPEPETASLSSSGADPSAVDVLNETIKKNLKDSSTPLPYDKDVFNVLLIGSDTRVSGVRGRSDSMILISVNKKTSTIIATSLLRDIYLQIPGITLGNRLNAAYAYGGASLLLSTIRQNFKIEVDSYMAVDFFSFIRIIDKVGGVDIDISDAEVKVANSYIADINGLLGLHSGDGKILSAGLQTLSGKQALGYSRIRYVGNADFGRTDRQRQVLEQVFKKVKKQNLVQLNDLLNTFLPEVTTNLSKGQLLSLVLGIPTYANYSIDSWHVPIDGSFTYMSVRGMSVLGIDFEKTTAAMQKRIYG